MFGAKDVDMMARCIPPRRAGVGSPSFRLAFSLALVVALAVVCAGDASQGWTYLGCYANTGVHRNDGKPFASRVHAAARQPALSRGTQPAASSHAA